MANNDNFKGIKIVKAAPIGDGAYLALTEDNELYHWQKETVIPRAIQLNWPAKPEKLMDNISDFFANYYDEIFIIKDNDLYAYIFDNSEQRRGNECWSMKKILENVRWTENNSEWYFAIDCDDNLYAWGYIPSLFVPDEEEANRGSRDFPVKIMENVRSISTDEDSFTIVLNNGELYCDNDLVYSTYYKSDEEQYTRSDDMLYGDKFDKIKIYPKDANIPNDANIVDIYYLEKGREIAVDDYSGEKYVKPKRVI